MTELEFPENAADVLKRIDEAIVGIELLDNKGREEVMRKLGGWLLIGKYGSDGKEVLVAFDKYCISECLREDHNWQVIS
jgi:hypothetical protein